MINGDAPSFKLFNRNNQGFSTWSMNRMPLAQNTIIESQMPLVSGITWRYSLETDAPGFMSLK